MTRILLSLMFAWALLSSGAAWAHAALVESTPAEGQVLAAPPIHARLRFNEPVSPLVIRLFDASGRTHDNLTIHPRNEAVEVMLPPGLTEGSYVLSYRVVSGDGHPIAGSLTFAVGQASASPVTSNTSSDRRVAPVLWLDRVVLYIGLFAGAGGAFFAAWLAPGRTERTAHWLVQGAAALGIAAALLAVGLQGVDALGLSPAGLAAVTAWKAGLSTTFGLTAAAAVAALAAALVSFRASALTWRRTWSLVGLLGVGLALALSGHASAAPPQWLSRPAVFVHGVAVAYWIGALLPLAALLRKSDRSDADMRAIVATFSAGAVVAVAALVVTGTAVALIQVPSLGGLIGTAYGQILCAKLVLVAALLGLAALNRYRLTPALAARGGRAGRHLATSATVEMVLAAVVFGLVATWRFTPPPRALLAVPEEPAIIHMHSPRAMAEVTLRPGRVGPAQASIIVSGGGSTPVAPKEVTLLLSNRSAGIEPIERKAERVSQDVWQVERIVLPVPGPWEVRLDVLISDFEKATLEGSVEVRR